LNLILFDEDLPMLTPVEVSRMIRSDAKIQHVPQLLVIVAQAIRSMVNEARDAGIDAMITKPVVPLRIMRTIEQLQFVRFAA
jgi:CheY-like chemotaxis protein